jgi:parallel beta-helix repeat protein
VVLLFVQGFGNLYTFFVGYVKKYKSCHRLFNSRYLTKGRNLNHKTFAYSLIISLLFTGMFISKDDYIKNIESSNSNIAVHLKSSANSDRIHINNNWTDTKTAGICAGDGTESNPYTLKNLIIDGGGIGNVIHIENSIENFKIENCTLFNSGGDFHDSGIYLDNVSNGQLINNTTYDNTHGMSIWYCLNLKIVRNRFYNLRGVNMVYTNDSIFYLNTYINNIYDFFFQWSTNQYNSQEKFSYTYNGKRFTNYLGNYWSAYSEPDLDGDGIIDMPYTVAPFVIENPWLRDYYPLSEPFVAYSNIEKGADSIPGFNLIILLGIIGVIAIAKVITNRNDEKHVNKKRI